MSMGLEAILAQRTDIDAELRKNKSPVTVMFTDLAGSTAFFDQFGDTAGVKWIEEHNSIVFPEIEKHKGTVVKTIGDSVMAYFPDAVEAVHAGADILKAIHATNKGREPKDKMYVRIALHHGLGYLRGGDIFGDVVNVAARLAKNCLPAQILVSEAVYLGAHENAGMEFRQMGSVQFRGKTSVENLFEVMWTDDQTYGDLRTLFPGKKAAVMPKDEEFTGGRYAIQTELGRGAMGVVYKAYDRMIGRHVAMKTIPLEVDESQREALVARLKKEANTAGALDHPNIVTVYDVGDEGGVFYFTMQYVEGRTLSSIKDEGELLPLEKLCDICDQMIGAMAFAHQAGVIHRDLKPSNMMLTAKGQVKIMDFGIAKFGDSGLTRAGTILGTPSYLAPEQAAGRRVDNRADIFSLGAILYELFTGDRAFSGESTTAILYKVMHENPIPPRAIEPSLSQSLNDVVMKALAKDPAERYQSCEELQEALREARRSPGRAAVAAPVTGTQYAERTVAKTVAVSPKNVPLPPAPKSKMPMIAGGVAALVLVGAGVGYVMTRKPEATLASPPAKSDSAPPAAASPATVDPASVSSEAGTHTTDTAASPRKGKGAGRAQDLPDAPSALRGKGRMREALKQRIEQQKAANEPEPAAPPAPVASGGLFSSSDIPDLMMRADRYAGRGEYKRAIITYEEILRIDPRNTAAREGLNRARAAAGIRR